MDETSNLTPDAEFMAAVPAKEARNKVLANLKVLTDKRDTAIEKAIQHRIGKKKAWWRKARWTKAELTLLEGWRRSDSGLDDFDYRPCLYLWSSLEQACAAGIETVYIKSGQLRFLKPLESIDET